MGVARWLLLLNALGLPQVSYVAVTVERAPNKLQEMLDIR